MEAALNDDIARVERALRDEGQKKKLMKVKHDPASARKAIPVNVVQPEVAKKQAQDLLAREKAHAAAQLRKAAADRERAARAAEAAEHNDASSVSSYSTEGSGSSVSSYSDGEGGEGFSGGAAVDEEVEIEWGIRRWWQKGQKLPPAKHETTIYWSVYVGSWVKPHVERMQMILENKGIPYTAIDLGEVSGMRVRRAQMEDKSGSSELPQLFFEGKFLGSGVDALQQLMYLNDSGNLGHDRRGAQHVIPKDLPRVKQMAMLHERKCAQ